MKWFCAALLLVVALVWVDDAGAQTCSASVASTSFGNVSPIRNTPATVTSTVTVNCTWPLVSAQPFVQICLNLSAAEPRQLVNGTNTMTYDLYQDSGHTVAWGATASGTTPISFVIDKPLLGTTNSGSASIYGLIPGNQATVPSVGNASTTYSQAIAASQTSLNYQFYTLLAPACASVAASGATFAFSPTATVVNDCIVTSTPVSFGTAGALVTALTARGGVSVTCTNGDAWRISLNGGNSGDVKARTMTTSSGSGVVNYQLYLDSALSQPWGDGTRDTGRATGTGTGALQALTIYGSVPVQATPSAGVYSDTITATVEF